MLVFTKCEIKLIFACVLRLLHYCMGKEGKVRIFNDTFNSFLLMGIFTIETLGIKCF